MKPILRLLMVTAMLFGLSAKGQFVGGPVTGNPITITTNFYIPGVLLSNVPTALANTIPIGKNGVGFFLRVGATNAASTTNMTIVLEQTVDASNWIDSHTFSLSVPQNGTTGYDYYTNLLPTTANLVNARYLRVKSIQNTNTLGIFITNFVWSLKE